MPDKFFLDTNIFVYSFDVLSKKKQRRAQDLIHEALTEHHGIISYQVIQEFLNVAMRKFAAPLSVDDSRLYLRSVLAPLCAVYPSLALYESALQIVEETKYGFYDALIVAAAVSADCTLLFSEDLQNGRGIHGLTIQNPF